MSIDLNYFARDITNRSDESQDTAPPLTREEGMIFAKATQDLVLLGGKILDERQRAMGAESELREAIRFASYAWEVKAVKTVDLNGAMPDLITCQYEGKYFDIAIPFLPKGGTVCLPVIVDKRIGFILQVLIEPTVCTVSAYARGDDTGFNTDMSISTQTPPWVKAYNELDARVDRLEGQI